MGGERDGERQYLHVCLAGAILIAWSACAQPRLLPEEAPGKARWEHLQPAQARIEKKDFEGALREYENRLSRPGNVNNDLVLFDMALLSAHYANPRKDYARSLDCFFRMVREYPGSPLVEEAKIWINLLETMERAKRVDLELEERKRDLK